MEVPVSRAGRAGPRSSAGPRAGAAWDCGAGADSGADRAPALGLAPDALAVIARHGAAAYPDECCGVLVGVDGARRAVVRALPAENTRADERARRYLIDPEAIRTIERAAEAEGLHVIGFYHSHPDHPARPSDFDREHAWPWYSYVILPVAGGAAGTPRAWRLRDDRSAFEEQEIRGTEIP